MIVSKSEMSVGLLLIVSVLADDIGIVQVQFAQEDQIQANPTDKIDSGAASTDTARARCPADVHGFSARSAPKTGNVTRVAMADFPSAGSTWLRTILNGVAREGQKYGGPSCGEPSCEIYDDKSYPKAPCAIEAEDLHCPCSWNGTRDGSLFFKSHFPAYGEKFGMQMHLDMQYNRTMHFDKILYLTRHPVPMLNSASRRWGGSNETSDFVQDFECWAQWWERARSFLDPSQVLMLKYEDVCLDPSQKIFELLQFFGGCYATISKESVEQVLLHNPRFRCRYSAKDIYAGAQDDGHVITNTLADLMTTWGYTPELVEGWNAAGQINEGASMILSQDDEQFLWAEVPKYIRRWSHLS